MLIKNNKIKCFECNQWLSIDEIFINVLYEGSITCSHNHVIGHTWDKEWIDIND